MQQLLSPALYMIVALRSQLFIEERVEVANLGELGVLLGSLADHCIVKIYNLGSTLMSLCPVAKINNGTQLNKYSYKYSYIHACIQKSYEKKRSTKKKKN